MPVHSHKWFSIYAAMPMTPVETKSVSDIGIVGLTRTASWASTSIASLLGLLIPSLAKIISARVNHNSALLSCQSLPACVKSLEDSLRQ